MTPSAEHIDGFERAMEYMTLAVAGNFEDGAQVIRDAFQNGERAISFVTAISNFSVGLVATLAAGAQITPSECWAEIAQKLQGSRPPEWER